MTGRVVHTGFVVHAIGFKLKVMQMSRFFSYYTLLVLASISLCFCNMGALAYSEEAPNPLKSFEGIGSEVYEQKVPPVKKTSPKDSSGKSTSPKDSLGKSTSPKDSLGKSKPLEIEKRDTDKSETLPPKSQKKPRSRPRRLPHSSICKPPTDYEIGDIPLEILDYEKLRIPTALKKSVPTSGDDLIDIEDHVARITKKVLPATVCLQSGGGSGSGVVITKDGIILSAAHVCGKPGRKFRVIFPNGIRVSAISLGTNHDDDSGLLKITDKGTYPVAPVAKEACTEGEWVICLGHPGGIKRGRPPVTRLGRVIRSCLHLVQTDCIIMPGDSGGPVFDMQGRVVAINSRIGPSSLLNYHVPTWMFLRDWDRFIAKENWGKSSSVTKKRAYLGVEIDVKSGEAKISRVLPGMAADKAGIKPGDIIVEAGGKEIRDFNDLIGFLGNKKPDDKVEFVILRDGKELKITVKLGVMESLQE